MDKLVLKDLGELTVLLGKSLVAVGVNEVRIQAKHVKYHFSGQEHERGPRELINPSSVSDLLPDYFLKETYNL